MRKAPCRGSCPIADSTWLWPTLPDEQAEPADKRDAFEIEGDLPGFRLQPRQREEAWYWQHARRRGHG